MNDQNRALAHDLSEATDELQTALQRASEASARIRGLIPRIGAVNALLDEIESVIRAGRQELGGSTAGADAVIRPTLVVPNTAPSQESTPRAFETPSAVGDVTEAPAEIQPSADLICFRLEFRSGGGPLDLRAVDDAVGEHPAVRDVALIDYDGRTATLKVWIVPTASASEVQQSLNERSAELFAGAEDVTIIALEDAA